MIKKQTDITDRINEAEGETGKPKLASTGFYRAWARFQLKMYEIESQLYAEGKLEYEATR